jgi:hypothetical protein
VVWHILGGEHDSSINLDFTIITNSNNAMQFIVCEMSLVLNIIRRMELNSTDLQRIPTTDGVRFELPRRQLGEFAKFGWFLVIFCGLASLFLLAWSSIWFWAGLHMFFEEGQVWGIGVGAVGLLGLAGIFFAAKFATLGWFVARDKTSCHVELNSKYLISNERLGLFNWRRKLRTDSIRKLGIESDAQGQRKNLLTISASSADAKSFLVAPGYPLAILERVIADVGTQINRQRSPTHQVTVSTEPHIRAEITDESDAGGISREIQYETEHFQPPDSKIIVYDHAGTDAFQVPPMGIWKGSKGLLGFALFWNGFMVVFTTVMIVIAFSDNPQGNALIKGTELLFAIAFLVLFWTIGIVSLIAAINAGKRSAMIGIADGHLFIERKSMFGTKWVEIPVDQVELIEVRPSGTEINSIPILELQIHNKNGKDHGLLSQLSNDDLLWIAQELRSSLPGLQQAAD